MKPSQSPGLLALLFAFLLTAAPINAQAIPGEENEDDVFIRVYDISDLFVPEVEDSPKIAPSRFDRMMIQQRGGPGLGGGGGGALSIPPSQANGQSLLQQSAGLGGEQGAAGQRGGGAVTRPRSTRPTVEDLIEVIKNIVRPDTWGDQGGAGHIEAIGSSLVVLQSEPAHRDIEDLLEQLRRRWPTTQAVRIIAHWAMLTPEEVAGMIDARTSAVDTDAVRSLLTKNAPRNWRAEITSFSHETVSLVSGRRVTVVASLVPLIGAGALAFSPEVQVLQAGATLQVTPFLMPDRETVVLNLRSDVLEVGSPERISSSEAVPGLLGDVGTYGPPLTAEAVGGPAKVAPTARYIGERAPQRGQQFATTLRMPLGRPVLVGGMTFEPSLESQPADPRQLYLFVEVSGAK